MKQSLLSEEYKISRRIEGNQEATTAGRDAPGRHVCESPLVEEVREDDGPSAGRMRQILQAG